MTSAVDHPDDLEVVSFINEGFGNYSRRWNTRVYRIKEVNKKNDNNNISAGEDETENNSKKEPSKKEKEGKEEKEGEEKKKEEEEEKDQRVLKVYTDYQGSSIGSKKIRLRFLREICVELEMLSLLLDDNKSSSSSSSSSSSCDLEAEGYIARLYNSPSSPSPSVYLSKDKKDLYFQFEKYYPSALGYVVRNKVIDDERVIKWVSYQLLVAVANLNRKGLTYKTLTPSDILINSQVDATVAPRFSLHFSSSIKFDITQEEYYDNISGDDDDESNGPAMHYRAPEEVLQFKQDPLSTSYKKGLVQVWSIGCMIAEMFLRRLVFQPVHRDIPGLLTSIFKTLGKPSEDFIDEFATPGAAKFCKRLFAKIQQQQIQKQQQQQQSQASSSSSSSSSSEKHHHHHKVKPPKFYGSTEKLQLDLARAEGVQASAEAIEVVTAMLRFDFRERPTIEELLKMRWFSEDADYKDDMPGVSAPLFPSSSSSTKSTTGTNSASSAATSAASSEGNEQHQQQRQQQKEKERQQAEEEEEERKEKREEEKEKSQQTEEKMTTKNETMFTILGVPESVQKLATASYEELVGYVEKKCAAASNNNNNHNIVRVAYHGDCYSQKKWTRISDSSSSSSTNTAS